MTSADIAASLRCREEKACRDCEYELPFGGCGKRDVSEEGEKLD